MKKSILLFSVLLLCSVYSNAQYWMIQNLNLPGTSRGVRDISVVDANTVWAICYDGAPGSGTNVLDFSHTNDGGNTWTAGLVGSDTTYAFSNICALSYSEAWVSMFNNPAQAGGGLWYTLRSNRCSDHQRQHHYSDP